MKLGGNISMMKDNEKNMNEKFLQIKDVPAEPLNWTMSTTSFNYVIKFNRVITETRPWGEFVIMYEDDTCKVKKITIHPGQAPSYQVHAKRDECWQIISGIGVARINDELIDVKYGDIITVKRGVPHSIMNTSASEDLVFIEIQTGDYFGEDDIIRLEDKYGR
jgi:mannose-6-phosphate isomerase-like protein (cupin superfamily)